MTDRRAVEVAPGVVFQEVEGELVLLQLDAERYYVLDDVGARCWHLLTDLGDLDAVVSAMLAEFEVDEATLRSDIDALLARLVAAGLVVPSGPAG
jgi:hypothetical protein